MLQRLFNLALPLGTPLGRKNLLFAAFRHSWPILWRLAAAYRRTIISRTRIVVVVGSFGKTTTTRAVLAGLGLKPSRYLGLNAYSSVAAALLRIWPGDRNAVLEVGIDRRGWMATYARMIRPSVVVVTAIGSEHNRSLGSLEVTRDEKAAMLRALSSGGLAVLNGDDPHVRWMAGQTRARVVTFGFGADNDVRARDYALDWPHGSRFTLHAGGEQRVIHSRLFGRHQMYHLLAAIGVGLEAGVRLKELLPRLEAIQPTVGRLQVVPLENGAYLVRDEFKSALETMDAALDMLAEIPAERRIAVLGNVSEPPGRQGPIYRRLGERLAQLTDRAVIVGGNHRRYAAGAVRAGMPRSAVVDAGRSVARAAEIIRADLRPGDVVLIKGRDTERLDRVALALEGRQVRCELEVCNIKFTRCDACPMLELGWHAPDQSFTEERS